MPKISLLDDAIALNFERTANISGTPLDEWEGAK